MDKKKRNIIIGVVAAVVVIFAVIFVIFAIPVLSIKDGQILAGVHLGPIDVSDCTKEEAVEKIEDYIKDYNKGKITFKASSASKEYNLSDLKLYLDNDAVIQSAMDVGRVGNLFERYNTIKKLENETITIDIAIKAEDRAIDKVINDFSDEYGSEVVEPTMKRENGAFVITEGKPGVVVDKDASKKAILDYLTEEWLSDKKEVELVAKVQEPKATKEELSKVKDVLGTYNTSMMGEPGRVTNLKVGTAFVNETILYPGESFSCVEVMHDADGAAAGYVEAGVFVGGQTVQGYGGGVCQIATTLYNAVLQAELEVVERHEHQMAVTYVPYSLDSTMAAGSVDFVFKNNSNTPIYIEAFVGNGVTITIYGVETRSKTRTISFESEVLSEVPTTAKVEFLEDKDPGFVEIVEFPRKAVRAQAWKVVKENGVVVSREIINKSNYKAAVGSYQIGAKNLTDEAKEIIQKAVETGDNDKVQQAIVSTANSRKDPSESESKKEESSKPEEKPAQ